MNELNYNLLSDRCPITGQTADSLNISYGLVALRNAWIERQQLKRANDTLEMSKYETTILLVKSIKQ